MLSNEKKDIEELVFIRSYERLNSKLNNIYSIIDKFSKFYEKDDDEEFENTINRINIYFTSIINEIKLSFYENTKELISREKSNIKKNKVMII